MFCTFASPDRLKTFQEEDNNNPWDDTLLIKAYESAFEKVKADVNRKCKQPAPSTSSQQKPAQQGPNRKWKVGDFCRAVFLDDGLKYEGVITKINGERCTIKYYGKCEGKLLKLFTCILTISASFQSAAAGWLERFSY